MQKKTINIYSNVGLQLHEYLSEAKFELPTLQKLQLNNIQVEEKQ